MPIWWMMHSSPQSRFHPPAGTSSMDKLSLRPLVLSKNMLHRQQLTEPNECSNVRIDLQAIVLQSSRDAEI